MHHITLELAIVRPGETNHYTRAHRERMTPGAHVAVRIDGVVAIEGAADPNSLEGIAEAIEASTLGMPSTAFRRGDVTHPDLTYEGWALRWLERAVRELREALSADMDQAIDTLTTRRAELERYK